MPKPNEVELLHKGFCHICDHGGHLFEYPDGKHAPQLFQRHLNVNHDKIDLICDKCQNRFQQFAKLKSHQCWKTRDITEFVDYDLVTDGSEYANTIAELTPYQKFVILKEDRKAVPNIFPPVVVPKSMRQYKFETYSNINGVSFIVDVLTEKIQNGGENLVHLDKNINIKRQDVHDIILGRENTCLYHEQMSNIYYPFIINETEDGFFVSLKEPPKDDDDENIPLNNISDLEVYQKYKKGMPGMTSHPHHYDLKTRRSTNIFLRPEVQTTYQIKHQTTFDLENYWRFCDLLKKNGVSDGHTMSIPSKALLALRRIRLGTSFDELAILFQVIIINSTYFSLKGF